MMRKQPMRSDPLPAARGPWRTVLLQGFRRHTRPFLPGSRFRTVIGFCILLSGIEGSASSSGAGFWETLFDGEQLTAINAKEFNGYVRTRLPNGLYQPETFAFGKGGSRSWMRDPTLDGLSFSALARILAEPLAAQNYLPARDPESTKLLIMVYWGTTSGGFAVMDGPAQDWINYRNARLLGFDIEAGMYRESSVLTAHGWIIRDLHAYELSDIGVSRYYVILRAFDFNSAWRQKKFQLLWETRFSLSERRHGFQQDLPSMAQSASLYFGQDSYGVVRKPLIREGRVFMGEPKVLGIVGDSTEQSATGSAAIPLSISGDWLSTTPGRPRVIIHVDPYGHSTFQNPSRNVVLAARVSVCGDVVTVIVPGWNIVLRGTHNGNCIAGTISEYGRTAQVDLTKANRGE